MGLQRYRPIDKNAGCRKAPAHAERRRSSSFRCGVVRQNESRWTSARAPVDRPGEDGAIRKDADASIARPRIQSCAIGRSREIFERNPSGSIRGDKNSRK